LVVQLALAFAGRTPILHGHLVDTDNYMWLGRLAARLDSRAWFDTVYPRLNAPFGHTINWTRTFDLALLALATPLRPFLGARDAVWAAGIVASPILHALACLAMA